MKTPTLGFIILFVTEPLKSGKFYGNILGLKPIEESPTFVLFALPNGLMLGLWSRSTAKPQVIAQPGCSEICFTESSDNEVNDRYQAWLKLGVMMLQAPHKMEGGYSFVAQDQDGHRIRVLHVSEQ